MRRSLTRLSLVLLSCTAATSAFGQDGTSVLNEQIQLGEIFADQELIVEEATDGVASATTALGNGVSAYVEHQPLDFVSSQLVGAPVTAQSYVQAKGTSGQVFINATSANGNVGDAQIHGGHISADVYQTVESTAPVTALAYSAAGGPVEHASGSATAIGNTQGYQATGGTVGERTVQENYGGTVAGNRAVFCCITGSGAFLATAVSNNVTSIVHEGESIHDVTQVMGGPVTRAYNNVYVVTGNNVAGAATASANLVHTSNTGGYAELNAKQRNEGRVEAENYVVLENWYGVASASAYGVANSADLVNGVYNDPVMRTFQVNNGDVASTSVFDGGAGEHVVNSAMSVGNSVSGYACGECYGVINATNRQQNNGDVRSSSRTYVAGSSGLVTGTSTAIGNTASYQSSSGH